MRDLTSETPKYPWEADEDSTIIANLAIGSLRDSLLKWLTTERGVHAETLLVAIGALAGFAAQNAAFCSLRSAATAVPKGAIAVAEAGGGRYYFGDRINGYLVAEHGGSVYPLWGFIAAAALQAGMVQQDTPDIGDMFSHIAKTVGTPAFGIPRVPTELKPHFTPRQALETFWPRVKMLLNNAEGNLVRG